MAQRTDGTAPARSTISVVVPTYRRVEDLRGCLAALGRQDSPPLEVIVVCRTDDEETGRMLARLDPPDFPLRRAHPAGPGVVAAYNAGLDAARGDVVSITDDDAVPDPDWLARVGAHFDADPALGGLGGRDRLYAGGRRQAGEERLVGRVQWFGRAVGNHHLGVGAPREVEILKGVNMSFRRAVLGDVRFDGRFRGAGAQVDCEMGLSLTLKRRGVKLVYDPRVVVGHFTGSRHDSDQRVYLGAHFSPEAMANHAHNETLALLDYLPRGRRAVFLAWACLIGSRSVPGLLQGFRISLLGFDQPHRRVAAALRGRWMGWRTWRSGRVGSGRGW